MEPKEPPNPMVNLFELGSTLDLALAILSLAILAYLLAIYVRLYLEMHQRFTLGLIIFAGILVLHNLSTTFYLLRGEIVGDLLGSPETREPSFFQNDPTAFLFLRVLPTVLEFAALVVLVWLARE